MAPPGGHYSHAVTANGFVFVSGELPIAPDGTKLNEAPFEQQAQQVLDNVALALKGAGSSIDKLTQVRVYVTDIASWPAFNTLYAKWAGSARPARCVVPVPQLHYGFKIEIEAVARQITGPGFFFRFDRRGVVHPAGAAARAVQRDQKRLPRILVEVGLLDHLLHLLLEQLVHRHVAEENLLSRGSLAIPTT